VTYNFANNSSADIDVAVINASGAVVGEGAVGPNLVSGFSAGVGEYWVVENASGGCLGVLEIGGGGTATVN
jgi:hypothetical protein